MTGSKRQPFNESIHPAEAPRVLAHCYANRAKVIAAVLGRFSNAPATRGHAVTPTIWDPTKWDPARWEPTRWDTSGGRFRLK